jgi:NitT/TauT family transport system permease protein
MHSTVPQASAERFDAGRLAEASRRALPLVVGLAVLIGVWELAGRRGWLGTSFPPLSSVVELMVDDSTSSLLWRSARATVGAAFTGFVIGASAGAVLAIVRRIAPVLGHGLERVAVTVHSIPLIAFGPILITVVGADTTPTIAAALAAYFPMFVAFSGGLSKVPPAYGDLADVLGASKLRRLRRTELPHALPSALDGLRLSAPAALLGAIIGEWFGAPRGLGVLIVSSMQNYQIEQLWAAALVGTLCSITAYALLSLAHGAAKRRYLW